MPLPMYREKGPASPQVRRVVGVAAGKGGVGKSTISVGLSLALLGKGVKVGLWDTDLYGPSIRRMLPEDRLPTQEGEQIFPALSCGLKTLSMAYFRGEGQALVVRAPIANNLIIQFLRQVDWGETDLLMVDFPPGTGDVQLTLGQQASLAGVVLVTTPQEIALMDVRKAANMFSQINVPIIGVVENMSYLERELEPPLYLFGKGGGAKLADELGVPLIGEMPLYPDLAKACDIGKPLPLQNAEHPAVRRFDELAGRLLEHLDLLDQQGKGVLRSFDLAWEKR